MRRQEGREPQDLFEMLQKQVDQLERRIKFLERAGATTIQTIDTTQYPVPQQGEATIHHPKLATFRYYHEDRWHSEGRFIIKLFADDEATVTGIAFIYTVPVDLDGAIMDHAGGFVTTLGGEMTVQITNLTQGHDFLSTPITVPAGSYDSSDADPQSVIIGANAQVAEGDRIAVDVLTDGGTLGAGVKLAFS